MRANETNRMGTFEQLFEAHGGRARWQGVTRIEASLSSGGLAFTAHCQPTSLHNLRIVVAPHARTVELKDFCHRGWRGLWTPEHVQIRDGHDALIMERRSPRAQFSRLVKQVCWDKLDILYFAGYALWNYLSFPFILMEPGVEVREVEPSAPGAAHTLLATFDATLPTHSRQQAFHLDDSWHLMRHDYTADVIGGWAKAANFCLASETVEGLCFYTRRKVYPRLGARRVLPLPTLVWIEIDDLQVNGA